MPTPLYTTLRFFLCLLLSTLFMVGKAQRYILHDREPYLPPHEATHLMESLDFLINQLDLDHNRDPVRLFEVQNAIYAAADGHSYLWKWERDSFRNVYQGYYHGYNFGGYRFSFRGEIHSYGGYGYWQFMPFLTYFDWETKGWEIRIFSSEFPRVRGATQRCVFREGPSLYVAFTEETPYVANWERIHLESDNFHRLDLSTNSWELLGTVKSSLIDKVSDTRIETEHYYGFFNNHGSCTILKKDSLLLKSAIPLSFTPLSRASADDFDTYSIQIKGDSIAVFNDLFYSLGAVDLKEVYESSGLSTELIYVPDRTFSLNNTLWVILLILLLIGGGWRWYRRRSKAHDVRPPTDFPYPELLNHNGQTINTETLDTCLEIHPNQSESSKRNRRSQILQDIDQHYPHIIRIKRVRSKEDKRIFEYQIRF